MSKHWCFSVRGYTEEDEAKLQSSWNSGIKYLIFAKEVGMLETPYLHGMISMRKKYTRQEMKDVMNIEGGKLHCYPTRLVLINIEYYKKDGTHTEWGAAPPN